MPGPPPRQWLLPASDAFPADASAELNQALTRTLEYRAGHATGIKWAGGRVDQMRAGVGGMERRSCAPPKDSSAMAAVRPPCTVRG